jgi:uncharacterized metal-binding protein YceD (DUF177 family)
MSERVPRTNEFSRPVAIESIGPSAQTRRIEAGAGERLALAERFGLLALHSLSAAVELERQDRDTIHAKGHLVADVVQSCVVTLEPVPAHIEADFACSYTAATPEAVEAVIDPLAEEEIEPLAGEEIDLGETVAQQLAIALDPYPRAPGAVWPQDAQTETAAGREGGKGPFAKLARLKKP